MRKPTQKLNRIQNNTTKQWKLWYISLYFYIKILIKLINHLLCPQVVPVPQVSPGPPVQRERKVTQAYQATAPKVSPAPLDSPDNPALLDFQAPLVCSLTIDWLRFSFTGGHDKDWRG